MGFNVGGRVIASQYGTWQAQNLNSINAGTQTLQLDRCYVVAGNISGKQFVPWATNAKLKISDANTETVTPITVQTPFTGSPTCTVTAVFSKSHSQGAVIMSATGGLAEALNDVKTQNNGAIVTIDASWSGQTSDITSFTGGSSNVFIGDLRGGAVSYYELAIAHLLHDTSTRGPAQTL